MGFFHNAVHCLRNYFTTSGRANRREFWFWIAFCALVLFIATMIDGIVLAPFFGHIPFEQDAGRPLATVTLALLTIPTFTAAVRRFHDSNRSAVWFLALCALPAAAILVQALYGSEYSGWWLLGPVAAVSAIPLAYFLAKGASKGRNRFG